MIQHLYCGTKKSHSPLFPYSLDNSDYQRNGDYLPTRLNAQKDGINLVSLTKLRSNPENNVGLLTMAKYVPRMIPNGFV